MNRSVRRFLRDEAGAVTVDYLPLMAAAIGVGILVIGGVAVGSQMLGTQASDTASEFDVEAMFDFTPRPAPQLAPTWGSTTSSGGDNGGAADFVPGGGSGACQGNPDVSCSGLGDGTNPGQGSGNNNAAGTPGGDGANNPNNADNTSNDNNGTDNGTSGDADDSAGNDGAGDAPSGGSAPDVPAPEPTFINHEFAPRSVPYNWGDWRDTTPWVDLSHLTGGQPAPFVVHGDGNPAFNLNGVEQTEGMLQWGAQITMDTPSVPGTSHTAYIEVTVGDTVWTGAYTITREPAPETPPVPAASYVAEFNIPYYWNNTYQNWFNRPSGIPANEWNGQPYTVSGDGNPVAHSQQGGWTDSGTMRWNGVSLRFDTPPPGETYTISLEFGDHVGVYTFTRASAP